MELLFIQFIISLVLLFIGTQLLVNASISISNKLNINRLIIGFTIVSLATSLPELFVTLQASMQNYHDYAIGNIIGSNISNISLVLGIIAIISPIVFSKKEIKLNYTPLIAISIAFVLIILLLGTFNIIYGLIAIFTLIYFNVFLLKKGQELISIENNENPDIFLLFGIPINIKKLFPLFTILIIGTLILWLGSDFLINSSKEIAMLFGISDRVISISLVAIGTSLPELFTSIYAAYKGETKLAIGNLLGSNIFNILAVLGITTCINDISIGNHLNSDAVIMLLITLFLIPCFYMRSIITNTVNQENVRIYRTEGVVLLAIYITYIISIFN